MWCRFDVYVASIWQEEHPFIRCEVRPGAGSAQDAAGELVDVVVEREATVEARVVDLVVWSTAALEGVVEITAAGIITSMTLGPSARPPQPLSTFPALDLSPPCLLASLVRLVLRAIAHGSADHVC